MLILIYPFDVKSANKHEMFISAIFITVTRFIWISNKKIIRTYKDVDSIFNL